MKTATERYTAIYVRVSTRDQKHRSQEPDLRRWAEAYSPDEPVRWFRDVGSGSSMARPAWKQVELALRLGEVSRLVVWRLDRLGRTVTGLAPLLEELRSRKVPLISVRDGFDSLTPGGAMVANILASVAQYELEVRGERQAAGIATAKAAGKKWGGGRPGVRYRVTREKARQLREMKRAGNSIAAIARGLGLSRTTVYSVLREGAGE